MRTRSILYLLVVLALFSSMSAAVGAAPAQTPLQPPANSPGILGPFTGETIYPTVWNGDLRALPQIGAADAAGGDAPDIVPARLTPMEMKALDAKATQRSTHLMGPATGAQEPAPPPIANFAGMQFSANGSGWPPDTNGDVGPNHYIQTVNTSVGIYDKTTGAAISTVTFNTFFTGPPAARATPATAATRWCSTTRWSTAGSSRTSPGSIKTSARITSASQSPRPATRWPVAGTSTPCRSTPVFSPATSLATIPNWAYGRMATTCRPTCSRSWAPASAYACGASTRPRC